MYQATISHSLGNTFQLYQLYHLRRSPLCLLESLYLLFPNWQPHVPEVIRHVQILLAYSQHYLNTLSTRYWVRGLASTLDNSLCAMPQKQQNHSDSIYLGGICLDTHLRLLPHAITSFDFSLKCISQVPPHPQLPPIQRL